MADNLTSSYLRITNAGPTLGSFLTSQVISPFTEAKKDMGQIFVLLEIRGTSASHRQVGQTLINTLKKSYYEASSTSDLQNFEQSLKKLNEVLAQIAQNGETSWIGNLDASFCLAIGDQAHVASAGRAGSWLLREGKISPLADPPANTPPHPLKTFSAITSGSLIKDDRIILGNQRLLEHFSLQELKALFDQEELEEAAQNFIRLLKKKKEKAVNLMVLEPTSSGPGLNFYLDESSASPLTQAVYYSRKYFFPWAKKTGLSTQRYFKTTLVPGSRQALKLAAQKARRLHQQAQPHFAKTQEKTRTFVSEKFKQISSVRTSRSANQFGAEFKDATIIGKPIYTINDYRAGQKKGLQKYLRLALSLTKKTIIILDNKIAGVKNWLVGARNRPLAMIVGALALVVILIISVSLQRRKQAQIATQKQQQQILAQARDKIEEGKTALVLADKETAALLFEEAITLSQKLSETDLTSQAQAVIDQAAQEADGLTQTTRLASVQPFAQNLSSSQIFVHQGQAYGLSDNILKKINILSGKTEAIQEIKPDEGAFQQVAFKDYDNRYLLTSQGQIFIYNIKQNSLEKLAVLEGGNKKALDLDTFDSNIYVLSPEEGQIWKYTPAQAGGLNAAVKFAQSSLKNILTKAKALAIDGSIYAVSNGQIVKINRGTQAEFKINSLPKAYSDFSQVIDLYTNEEIPSIYILDQTKPRIIEIDKSGNYLRQYIFPPEIKKPISFQVDHIGRKAWVLTDQSSAFELDL